MLARGAQGPEVVRLQRRLRALQWQDVIVDGQFGLYTDCAVRLQQLDLGLKADGVVGPITERALARAHPEGTQKAVDVRLPVAYRTQRDNRYAPSSTCNVTSFAMALSHLGVQDPTGKQLEDRLYEMITSPDGVAYATKNFPWAIGKNSLWTVHGMLTWAAAQLGVKSRFLTTASWSDVLHQLNGKRPVVLSARFTASGHIVCVSGCGGSGDVLIVDDPWGDWNHGYRERDGSDRVYTQQDLREIGCEDGRIWAHFFE